MSNSADRIYDFFTKKPASARVATDVYSMFYALEDIRRTLDTWRAVGEDVSMYSDALPRWTEHVSGNLGEDGKWVAYADMANSSPTPGDMGLLKALSLKMSRANADYDDQTRKEVSKLVDKVSELLVADTSLPESLRWHIAKLLLHVKTCLDEYAIRGDLDLDDAVERLIGSMRVAEEKSGNRKAWEDVWQNYGQPILVGLFVELTAGAGLASILSLTAGS